jgi:DNA-binding response OmpR family regulator
MVARTPDGTGQRILVIDDDIAIRVLLQAVLKRMNFKVDLAEDGAAGLEKLKHTNYDLILLDLMMPRVNGYEFIDRLDGETYDPRPHIIVFTAAGQREVDKLPPNSVCNAILKPFDLEIFVSLIEQCLAGHHTAEAQDSSRA